MAVAGSLVFGIESVEYVSQPQAVPGNLVCIGGADSFSRSAYFGRALCTFIGGVQKTVCREYEMDFLAYL